MIHRDQVGFIPIRQAGDNIRCATVLSHAAKTRKIPSCFLSLDIKKAFDTVSWSYMHFTLRKWDLALILWAGFPHYAITLKNILNMPGIDRKSLIY